MMSLICNETSNRFVYTIVQKQFDNCFLRDMMKTIVVQRFTT